MAFRDYESLKWNDYHLYENDETVLKERACKIVKEYLLLNPGYAPLSIIVSETEIPYHYIKELIDEGRIDVIVDRSENSILLEQALRQKNNGMLKNLLEFKKDLNSKPLSTTNKPGGMHSYR